ncbi:DUF4249 domain-containing protein [Rhodocytophaga rosea]|uniref:DUF4249 domain-containing protein n=1 Tax=Rhodocytophaga rosea TaxID=2704465 RepID=A0A6C0GTL7_9BACT|nr:DUF4249 domain-containing protein [Rhodocytophaga rosea]QHT71247.1 DUF4249 domain-containing protein [Rhodocytophaga rosea]
MKIIYYLASIGIGLFLLSGCDLEKEIDVPLPPYENKLVVECYLEAGKPYRMAVSESSSYFAGVEIPDVAFANAIITSNNRPVRLRYEIEVDEENQKAYNYSATNIIDSQLNKEYELEVKDTNGRTVTGKAKFLPFVPITEVEYKYNEDSTKAFILAHFEDDPSQNNYFRFQVHKDSLNRGAELDFTLDDTFASGTEITIGTGYNYEPGDTVYVTVYHIERSYFDFLESVESASSANGNPFAQPARVKSTVQGGIGVFATLVYDRKRIVIE